MAETAKRAGDPRRWQTVLFVPADRPEMLAKAAARGADAVLVDLEDAIPPSGKAAARRALREWLLSGGADGIGAVCVRVNAVGEGVEDDLAALVSCELDGIMLPKAAAAAEVAEVSRQIRLLWNGTQIGLIPQVESVKGILALAELVRVEGVIAVAFGGEDFSVDLGVTRSPSSLELQVPRTLIALHARGVDLPAIDTVYTAIDDEAGLVRETTVVRQLGFSGKLLIHPRQVEPVRQVFAPSEDELAWAHKVLAVPLTGPRGEAGVHVVDGKMVDAPVLAQAERIIARRQ